MEVSRPQVVAWGRKEGRMEKSFRALESETWSPAKEEMMRGGEGTSTGQVSGQSPVCSCQPYTFSDGRDIEIPEKGTGVAAGLREAVLTASPLPSTLTHSYPDSLS